MHQPRDDADYIPPPTNSADPKKPPPRRKLHDGGSSVHTSSEPVSDNVEPMQFAFICTRGVCLITVRGIQYEEKSVLKWKDYPGYDMNWGETVHPSMATADYWGNAIQEFSLEAMNHLVASGDELISMGG